MNDADRYKLHGTYHAPRCTIGKFLTCRLRGKVRVRFISDAPIPLPCILRDTRILCGDLVRAVKVESAQAVAHWWGVTAQTVTIWWKYLGVEENNVGTVDLRRRLAPETLRCELALRKMRKSLGSPERREKIARAKRGKPRPAHVVEAVRKAHLGTKASKETRKKMSDTHKQKGCDLAACHP
jgi:hypothetical protein